MSRLSPAPPRRPQIRLNEPQRRVLMQLRIEGSASRTRLAQLLGMNGATMTRLTQSLLALDLIEERDSLDAPARGRPMVPLTVSGHGGWAIGATPHPGWLELVIVDFCGRPLVHDTTPFDSPDPRIFARSVEARLQVIAAAHGFMRGKFLGLGVAVPGYALPGDRNRRVVVERVAGWNDVPLADILGDALAMPVWIENDASAAALAEYYQDGIIGRYRSVLTLFLGHGIGGGLIADRDLFLGEHGNAGEVGRLFPGHRERPSGIDLLQVLREAGVQIDSLAGIEELLDSHAPLIASWTERVIGQLEQAVLSGTVWLDPGAVIVSGALPLTLLQRIADGLAVRSRNRNDGYRSTLPEIHASSIGSRAVVIGAAMIPVHAVTASQGRFNYM
ncbi:MULTISPECIES: ROK family transcriptional regulator [Sphingomonas]|jgi:predicted NBD/HSP70 family sugar kinase|uniref:ROK family transcriptional regulator n=1 Tax=Sphingomonas TaxID=13687 RepID=UPI0017B995BD|nr:MULTISPECIES: ROK family transcriptional regulator [Sphingomonas]MBB4047592.1 putative NBD/HSP70 family sugar kinase [Sphingomonas zeae]MDK8187826.1 ROK family transcriptional regulator [Sphingomonas zeae]MDK8217680.1 ROK family transcriptional regulator [Sphingomonas sp. UMB7805-LC452B]